MKVDEILKRMISTVYNNRIGVYPSEKIMNKVLKIIKKNPDYKSCNQDVVVIGIHNWLESIKQDGGNPIDFNDSDQYFLYDFKAPKKKKPIEEKIRGDIRAESARLHRYPLTKTEEDEIFEIIKANTDYPKYCIDDVIVAIQDWSEEINKLIGYKEKQ